MNGFDSPACTADLVGAIHVPVDHEEPRFAIQAEVDADARGAIGYYSIGPKCAKQWRKEFGG